MYVLFCLRHSRARTPTHAHVNVRGGVRADIPPQCVSCIPRPVRLSSLLLLLARRLSSVPASASAPAHRIYNHTSHIRFSAPLPPAFACAALLPVVVCPQPPSLLLPLTTFDPLLTTASSRAPLTHLHSLSLILAVSLSAAPIIPFRHFTLRTFHWAALRTLGIWFGSRRGLWSGPVGRSCVRLVPPSPFPLFALCSACSDDPPAFPSPALLSYTGLRTFTLCSSAHCRARPSPGRPSGRAEPRPVVIDPGRILRP